MMAIATIARASVRAWQIERFCSTFSSKESGGQGD
jgi:hypothetical protein